MLKIYNGTPKKDEMEMRKVYSSKLGELMEKHNEIIALEADLMNAITTDKVQKEYPERVINCGIMEANMVGIAAGMSIAGKYPFAHTFTAFASRRCFDQLFMSGAYQKNNIKIICLIRILFLIKIIITNINTTKIPKGIPYPLRSIKFIINILAD